jgi:hypothetical protein
VRHEEWGVNEILQRLLKALGFDLWRNSSPSPDNRTALVARLMDSYGIRVVENDAAGNARPLITAELDLIRTTVDNLGPTWYEPFRDNPLNLWVDRHPGGGHYGNNSLRIGDPGYDLSILYRILIHEGTHASNEYRGWPYEKQWCTRPGLDWRKTGDTWTHPRQQGKSMQPGDWETLPVDARDVSVAPGEDLAEMVRYYVHSVKNERAYLWPLDRAKPARYLWMTSPTRFMFVRDVFLKLPPSHPWHKTMEPELEQRAARNLGF